jgi:hypothetical protein
MIVFFLRALHPMGEKFHDVLGIVLAKYFVDVVEPPFGFDGVTEDDCWWPVEVEASNPDYTAS